MMKVLFFSKDPAVVEEIALALKLRWPDLEPMAVAQGGKGLHVIEQQEPELVVVCEHLSDMSIWQIIKEIRRFADTPIVVAAAKTENELDIVRALEMGADDYIAMPCSMMVLMARDRKSVV